MSVGNSSASSAPNPAVHPDPRPSAEERAPEQHRVRQQRLPVERQRIERRRGEQRVEREQQAPAVAVRQVAEHQHAGELPELRGQHPQRRPADRLVHLGLQELRQPGVAGPVRPELQHRQHEPLERRADQAVADDAAAAPAPATGAPRAALSHRCDSGRCVRTTNAIRAEAADTQEHRPPPDDRRDQETR